MDIVYYIFEYLFCLVDVTLLYLFLKDIFGLKENINKIYYFFIVIFFSGLIYIFSIGNLFFLPNIFIFLLFDLLISLFFIGKFKDRFLHILLYNFVLIFTEIITFNLFVFFWGVKATLPLTQLGLQRTLIGIFSKIMLYISISLITQNLVSNETKLPQKFNNYLYSIYIISIIIMIAVFKFSLDYMGIYDPSATLLIICFGFIFIILLVQELFQQLNKYFIVIEQSTFIKSDQNLYDRYFKNLDIKNKENNKFVHDIKNHLLNIKNLINRNNSKDAVTYISEIISDYSINTHIPNSGNEIIDIVINQKQSEACIYGISIHTNIMLTSKINVSDMHLSSLLFNAIDNAIYETKSLENKDKQILINIYERKNYLYIEVKNNVKDATNSIYKAKNKITSKSNNRSHGYGVLIIEDIIKKYNGYLDFKVIENYFTIIMVLEN